MPKVELHRHLEGSIRVGTIFELSRRAGVELPAGTPDELAEHVLLRRPVNDLEEALRALAIAQNSVRTYEAVRRIAVEAVEDLAAENVRLAELRFSPEFLCEPGGLDWDGAMDAIVDGIHGAATANDVAIGLIAIASRNYGLGSAEATVAFALRRREELVGFDLAGPEVGFPPRGYAEALAPLRASGLGLTVHYGESGPPAYSREAVEVLSPTRLGHGLSVAWDREVTALVRDRGVTLEMCPWSNWLTGGVATTAEHPAGRLLRDDVRVTLNSDDPGLFGTDLSTDFEIARDELGFEAEDFARVTGYALEASFLPGDVKAAVRERHFGAARLSPSGT